MPTTLERRDYYSRNVEPAPSRFTSDGAYAEWAKRADAYPVTNDQAYRSRAQSQAYAAGRVAIKRRLRRWAPGEAVIVPGIPDALEWAREHNGRGMRAYLRGVASILEEVGLIRE